MRVSHVVASLEARYGGPSKSVLETSRAQAKAGNDVVLFATDPGTGYTRNEGPLSIEVFKRGWPGAICPSPSLGRALSACPAEAIHCHGLWLRTLAYGKKSARLHGAPFVVAPRGMMAPWAWGHHRLRKQFASLLVHPGALRAVTGWHATSEEEASEIRRLGFGPEVCVAPNGVEMPDAGRMSESREAWLKLVPEANSRPIALFYSRFHSKKRVTELVRAWAELPPNDWCLLVAGIPEEFSCDELRRLAASLGCADRVRVQDGANLPPPYAIASLFVLPSHNENFGLVIAEAMAFGVPIVVTDTTPWQRANSVGAGWCVPWPDFPRVLGAALSEPSDALRKRGGIAREWVASDYSWEKPAKVLLEFYASLRK